MTTIGEILGQFAEFIVGLWPLRIVQQWEQGVRMYKGRTKQLLRPGLHWFIPLLGDIITRESNIEVIETDFQTVRTEDGVEATFALAVKLKVRNLRRTLDRIHSVTETVQNEVMGQAAWACAQLEWDHLRESLGPDTRKLIQDRLADWGITVLEVVPVTLTRAQAIRLIVDRAGALVEDE